MRVFVAAEISEEARAAVAERIGFLRRRFPDLRVGWDKPEKLHLTLKFLGEIEGERLADLFSAVETAANGFEPFELKIENAGVFPPRGRARVLWLGVGGEMEDLREIQARIEAECAAIGFEREKRDFKPHLTIARLKEPHMASELVRLHLETDFPVAYFRVSEITVFQSELTPRGSIYKKLKSITNYE